MLLGFKTQIKIKSVEQRIQLAKHAGVARHAWNWGLSVTKDILNYNKLNSNIKLKFPSGIDLHKLLVEFVKPEYPWYYESSKCAPQQALRNLSRAWSDCFSKKRKAPRYKKKGKNDSFYLEGSISVVDHFQIKVPRIGILETYERLPKGYKPKNVTISRIADKWFISYKLEVEPRQQDISQNNPVGIDLGILAFATLSTGESIYSPKPLKHYEHKLRKLQYQNRNKIIGSNSWKKAQTKIARLHFKIANIRKDFIHKLTTKIAKNHSYVVIENLNVSGMLKNRKLAKAISDCGFHEFKRQLTYKCELYGSKLVLADRFFPSSKLCSSCGNKKESLSLKERTYNCNCCGLSIDRDWNASINLLSLLGGVASDLVAYTVRSACGQEVADNLG